MPQRIPPPTVRNTNNIEWSASGTDGTQTITHVFIASAGSISADSKSDLARGRRETLLLSKTQVQMISL